MDLIMKTGDPQLILKRSRQSYRPLTEVRTLADQAFSRAAGAPLVPGNRVRLLKDARENYPAWLDAIGAAEQYIHFESYIIHEDEAGYRFADALISKAKQGVRVRLIYDWLGGLERPPGRSGTDCATAGSRCAATTRRVSILPWAGSAATTAR